MRARTLAAAGIAVFVATAAVAVTAPEAKRAKAKKKRKRAKRPSSNAPKGWTWPPSAPMKRQGKACLKTLRELGVAFERGKRARRIATPVVVEDMTFGGVALVPRFRKPPFPMDCHLAVSLARIGPALRELGVAELRFSTIHDYRRVRVNGSVKNTLSRHSFGLAVDVYEMVTDDGTLWTVETDYHAGDSVLHEVEDTVNASGAFRMLLTPQNDAKSHDDHYHFEAEVPEPELTDEERKAERAERKKQRRKARKKRNKRRRSKRRR
jgi:hypothetical protein